MKWEDVELLAQMAGYELEREKRGEGVWYVGYRVTLYTISPTGRQQVKLIGLSGRCDSAEQGLLMLEQMNTAAELRRRYTPAELQGRRATFIVMDDVVQS
jgi:hypothetical protein